MTPPFEPTECGCAEDQANCTRQPGHLLPGQLRGILKHLGAAVTDAAKFFWNSPGMVLGYKGSLFRLRTITPRFENGACIFLLGGRCTIHAVAPFGCRFFDVHMPTPEADERAAWGVQQILDSRSEYEADRDALPEATHYKGATIK